MSKMSRVLSWDDGYETVRLVVDYESRPGREDENWINVIGIKV